MEAARDAVKSVGQFGGGIKKAEIGKSTTAYEAYFSGDNAAGKDASKRKDNCALSGPSPSCSRCRFLPRHPLSLGPP